MGLGSALIRTIIIRSEEEAGWKPEMNRPSLMERWAWSRSREKGTALLIALFALLLVAVIAMALIVSSGTETALVDNYHSATSAYYSALAGLEEGRGRLSSKSPDYLNAVPGSLPSP